MTADLVSACVVSFACRKVAWADGGRMDQRLGKIRLK